LSILWGYLFVITWFYWALHKIMLASLEGKLM
jgi:hypothetical protein